MMVLCFVVIDLIMLVAFSVVEGSRGGLMADRVLDKEHSAIAEGVRGGSVYSLCVINARVSRVKQILHVEFSKNHSNIHS